MKKLLSRKFIAAMTVALLTGLNDGFNLGLGRETILVIAGTIVAWILGESAADAAHAWGGQAAGDKSTR